MISANKYRTAYVLSDYVMANIAWCLFNILRYNMLETTQQQGFYSLYSFMTNHYVVLGQLFFPMMMLGIFYLSGYYAQVFFKSRLDELINTMGSVLVGTILIFFIALINDDIPDRMKNYELMLVLYGLMFSSVYIVRAVLTNIAAHKIHNREWAFNTLIVGTSTAAIELERRLNGMKKAMGFKIIGYVDSCPEASGSRPTHLPVYTLDQLPEAIASEKIVNLIVTPHRHGIKATVDLLNKLFPLDLPTYISPSLYHIITSSSRISNIVGEPLIDVSRAVISPMTLTIKRVSDIAVSAVALTLLIPLFAILAIAIKLDSKGPVFYRQRRVGYHKRQFNIYKFRSMRTDAEDSGPALSTVDDPRVTTVGRFMRKYRLDELPQFWNVIKGDMSLVGPRPEREYYIQQIIRRAPYYSLVHQVRPGITSWGMVKHGYASNVDEMIKRLPYDLLYIENISFSVDLKILFYTVSTVLTGKGV